MNYREIDKFLRSTKIKKDVWSLYKSRKEMYIKDAAENLGKSRTNVTNAVTYLVEHKILAPVVVGGKTIRGLYKKHDSVINNG